jgi:PAS domain S-box-containing protein
VNGAEPSRPHPVELGDELHRLARHLNVTAEQLQQHADELGRQRRQLDQAQQIAQVGGWESHITTNRAFWSDQAYRIYGLEPQSVEASYELFLDHIHPDDLERVRETTQRAFQGARSLTFDHRIIRPDGSVRALESRVEVITDEGGSPLKLVGTTQDITERKRAEEELRLSEERFRTLADSAPVGIFLTNAEGLGTYVNGCFRELTGIPPDEPLGEGFSRVLHPEDRERVLSAWQGAVSAASEHSDRFRIIAPDGRLRFLEVRGVPLRGPEDELSGFIGVLTDITAQVEAQAATATARDEALEASRLKSEFLANMSHEIRTPLNAVIGMTELLVDTELDPVQREYAQTIRSSGESLLQVINDILDFSKIEAGRMEIEAIGFDLRALVDDVAGMLVSQVHEKGLELTCLIRPDVPTAVRGDPAGSARFSPTSLPTRSSSHTKERSPLRCGSRRRARTRRWYASR